MGVRACEWKGMSVIVRVVSGRLGSVGVRVEVDVCGCEG